MAILLIDVIGCADQIGHHSARFRPLRPRRTWRAATRMLNGERNKFLTRVGARQLIVQAGSENRLRILAAVSMFHLLLVCVALVEDGRYPLLTETPQTPSRQQSGRDFQLQDLIGPLVNPARPATSIKWRPGRYSVDQPGLAKHLDGTIGRFPGGV